jgi:hypothetical protein
MIAGFLIFSAAQNAKEFLELHLFLILKKSLAFEKKFKFVL